MKVHLATGNDQVLIAHHVNCRLSDAQTYLKRYDYEILKHLKGFHYSVISRSGDTDLVALQYIVAHQLVLTPQS